jgi:hypothetical protein
MVHRDHDSPARLSIDDAPHANGLTCVHLLHLKSERGLIVTGFIPIKINGREINYYMQLSYKIVSITLKEVIIKVWNASLLAVRARECSARIC